MKTTSKKIIAGAVSSALLLGMFPAAVFANADTATQAAQEVLTTASALQFCADLEQTTPAAIGFANGAGKLDVTQIGRYSASMSDPEGGVMEIVDFNSATGWAYAINGKSGKLVAISLNHLQKGDSVMSLDGDEIDVKALVETNEAGFSYGDMTSVAVSPDGKLLATAVQADKYNANGRVVLFQCNADGTLTFVEALETGVQPDMVTFTPDGSKILTANEGEPREGYGENVIDPAGSVTIVDVASQTAQTVGFEKFSHDTLAQEGIVLKKDATPAADLEPEYIAADNNKAYITLQEANAIAVLDLTSNTFSGIYSVGFENYANVAIDIDKKDERYAPKTYDSLRGIRMPDGISMYKENGKTYLLTANEGDSREWGDEDAGTAYLNEDERNFGKDETSPTGAITAENSDLKGKVVFFDSSDYDGLDEDKDYLFGGRSFTLFEVTENGLNEVFDSGNTFETKTAAYLPDFFNCSNDSLIVDDRSGKKGPEAETVVTGKVGNKTYAFVTQERIGGVMMFDITNPAQSKFVNYINSRDFNASVTADPEKAEDAYAAQVAAAADNSPEGLKFIPASESPTGEALLLAACEVGGTVAVYELTGQSSSESSGGSSGSSSSSSSGSSSVQSNQYDKKIVLQVNNNTVTVNGKALQNDVAPIIVDGRTMVPIRVITETLGGTVNWSNRTVTLTIDGKLLQMTIGQIMDGFDAAPIIRNNRTYVPIRYVAEALGAKVVWSEDTQQITITK